MDFIKDLFFRNCSNQVRYITIRKAFQSMSVKVVISISLITNEDQHEFQKQQLKEHNLICLPNKIRLNLINTFVMSKNKHISKKTPCFPRKISKNEAKPNEFERRILKLSCYACSDNPKMLTCISIFRNASSQNEFRFNLLRCMTETTSAALQ